MGIMWTDIDRYVERHHMLEKTDQVVIGLSGGADSICLARYFLYLRENGGPRLAAVHVNHMLRGEEAERDQEFVRQFCEQWNLPLYIFREDVRQISIRDKVTLEEAGRRVRYACFRKVPEGEKEDICVRVAVAHHADDLAETMIFRMIRGTGPKGLVGIRPVQGDIIRPLLGIRKEKIYELLDGLEQDYVEDSTNKSTEYSRNYIRRRILSDMERINPNAVEHLCSLARQEADLLSYVEPQVESICGSLIRETKEGFEINVNDFLCMEKYVRQEVARRLLFLASGREKDIGCVHVEQLLKLIENGEGKQNDFPYAVSAVRRGFKLVLSKKRETDSEGGIPASLEIILPEYEAGKKWNVPVGGDGILFMKYEPYCGQQIVKKDCEKYFDYDTIKYKLFLRTRLKGDFFVFNDKGGHKRLNRYFIDNKIPREQRDRQLLLAEGSHIIWILGGRISEACRITPETKRMLVIAFRRRKK